MKFKILVRIVEKLLKIERGDDEPRADMYLPDFLLALGIVLLAVGTACAIVAVIYHIVGAAAFAVFGLVVGAAAVMCWKNQNIRVISSEKFEYTTFLGKTYTFAFSEIKSLRRNRDSLTLYVGDKKVHMEAMAIISDRLADAINRELANKSGG